ncbi:hypothetical protein H5410_022292 [Solanum commersonii]|uniref:Uncharacterized protein n=1 Tax=Solanum commersonii TaxID=4109 RepID=A0A9J5ZDJ7_SOLCO|nr:hypothetical protein H5410_022292 [Solanum commersonii]
MFWQHYLMFRQHEKQIFGQSSVHLPVAIIKVRIILLLLHFLLLLLLQFSIWFIFIYGLLFDIIEISVTVVLLVSSKNILTLFVGFSLLVHHLFLMYSDRLCSCCIASSCSPYLLLSLVFNCSILINKYHVYDCVIFLVLILRIWVELENCGNGLSSLVQVQCFCSLSTSSPSVNSSKCLLAAKLSSFVYTVIAIFFKLFSDRVLVSCELFSSWPLLSLKYSLFLNSLSSFGEQNEQSGDESSEDVT